METTGIVALFALTIIAALGGFALSQLSRAVLALENLPKRDELLHEMARTRTQVEDINRLVHDVDRRLLAIPDDPRTPAGFAPPGMYMPGMNSSSDPNAPAGSLVPITAAMKITGNG